MKNTLFALSLSIFSTISLAQDFSKVEIQAEKASGDVYMLTGSGGNIGVLATDEGLLLVDDQFTPLAEKIEQAMQSLNKNKLKYVVNTHYHGDHTGSNTYFARHAPIFAHENVRQRLSNKKDHQAESLPVVTYQDGVKIHLANEEVQLTHLPSGHTDGDTVVYFKHANVLHTGDLFFEIGFPYVDIKAGGSVQGYLANVNYMIKHYPDDVVIIPGHGKLTNKAALKKYAQMLQYSINHVKTSLAAGMSEQAIISAGLTKEYKHLAWRFISEERWLKTLIKDLK